MRTRTTVRFGVVWLQESFNAKSIGDTEHCLKTAAARRKGHIYGWAVLFLCRSHYESAREPPCAIKRFNSRVVQYLVWLTSYDYDSPTNWAKTKRVLRTDRQQQTIRNDSPNKVLQMKGGECAKRGSWEDNLHVKTCARPLVFALWFVPTGMLEERSNRLYK